ncbi:two-component response regulator ARR14-like [Forsythia ovata]|uniref:Two-component response regulator ARR14-like n=1 Tax=Forsythia ovata TaxID=205694 RepID=A0ABD1W9S6_9LAMI
MDCTQISRKECAVPIPFRGLQVLVVDNDTISLLHTASILEQHSYKVATTDLAAVAVRILQERSDRFDLVMVDFNMSEMDCFEFIERIQPIKDFPIIVMSSTVNRDLVEEAMTKGACFFLKKPISSETLKNVWQHVYRKRRCQNNNDQKEVIKTEADQEIDSECATIEQEGNVFKIDRESNFCEPKKEQVGDSEQIENDLGGLVDKKRSKKSSEIRIKRSRSTKNNKLGELKRTCSNEGNKKKTRAAGSRSAQDNPNNVKPLGKGKGINVKKPRTQWTPELQLKFEEVISSLGEKDACSTRVLERMNVPNLTQRQVARHLQEFIKESVVSDTGKKYATKHHQYRVQSQTTEGTRAASSFAARPKIVKTLSNSPAVNKYLQIRKQDDSVEPSDGHNNEKFNSCRKKFLSAIPSTSPGVENLGTPLGSEKFLNNLARNLRSFHGQNNGGTRIFNKRCDTSPDDVALKTDGRGKQSQQFEERIGNSIPYFPENMHRSSAAFHQQLDGSTKLDGSHVFPDSDPFPMTFMELLQEKTIRKGPNSSEDSPKVSKFSTGLTKVNQKFDAKPKLAPSSYLSNKKQSQSTSQGMTI